MKVQKEGLKIYRIEESVQSEYFLSVEYQTLRLNQPETLLPVLLREKDGQRILLYDITEGKNLMDYAGAKGLSWKDCRQFLKNILRLMEELEELMLEMEHVSFEPEQIYRKDETHFQWMYIPDQIQDVRQGIESFFAWMLSKIDYGDGESVRYIYHVYWSIRNQSFSREMIEECLNDPEEEKEPVITSYEDYFKENQTEGIQPEEKEWTQRGQKKVWMALTIGLLLLLIIDVALLLYFLVLCVQNHFPEANIRYLIGTVVVSLFLADGIYQIRKRCREELPVQSSQRAVQHAKAGDHNCEEEGKTMVLNVRKDMLQPALKSMDTGEVTGLYTFPFYIGNLSGLNQLLIDDETVSRQHAVIVGGKQPGTYVIQGFTVDQWHLGRRGKADSGSAG